MRGGYQSTTSNRRSTHGGVTEKNVYAEMEVGEMIITMKWKGMKKSC
jgi:hypothetical protein